MKLVMGAINLLAALVSLMSVCAFLVTYQFGKAWLMVLPLAYSMFNFIAIERDKKKKG